MDIQEALIRVQSAYPRVYLSCHTRHQNSRTTPHKLSQRDGSILAHVDEHQPKSQRLIARHMGLAKSTLSEALAGLDEMGYITRTAHGSLAERCRKRGSGCGAAEGGGGVGPYCLFG